MCGEQSDSAIKQTVAQGSSPRVRGTVGDFMFEFAYVGIIPACAGNSYQIKSRAHQARDHPRVCGEQGFN